MRTHSSSSMEGGEKKPHARLSAPDPEVGAPAGTTPLAGTAGAGPAGGFLSQSSSAGTGGPGLLSRLASTSSYPPYDIDTDALYPQPYPVLESNKQQVGSLSVVGSCSSHKILVLLSLLMIAHTTLALCRDSVLLSLFVYGIVRDPVLLSLPENQFISCRFRTWTRTMTRNLLPGTLPAFRQVYLVPAYQSQKIDNAHAVGNSVRIAAGLVDLPASHLTCQLYEDFVRELFESSQNVSVESIDCLKDRRFGGLYNVGKGAAAEEGRGPRMLVGFFPEEISSGRDIYVVASLSTSRRLVLDH